VAGKGLRYGAENFKAESYDSHSDPDDPAAQTSAAFREKAGAFLVYCIQYTKTPPLSRGIPDRVDFIVRALF